MSYDYNGGWIPDDQRTAQQQLQHAQWLDSVPMFGDLNAGVNLPDEALNFKSWLMLGLRPLRIYQQIGSCLPWHAPVLMADGTLKPISQIKAGDSVVTHTGATRAVLGVQSHITQEKMRRISTGGIDDLFCTDGHLLPVKQHENGSLEWARAEDVAPGDLLLSGSSQRVVENHAIGVPSDPVWDIHVDIDHTFIAWGFVVHNCVGAGGAVAYGDAMAGDVVYRGSQEAVEIPFPWATWGKGRELGGMNGRGEGSFGSAQAEAVEKWGYVPIDHPGVPQPKRDGDWLIWTKDDEYSYSWPGRFPIAEAQLTPEANKHRMGKVLPARTLAEIDQAAAQGYGITMASNYGSRTMTVKDGFLIAKWDGSWAHQMTIDGYKIVPSLGKLYLIKNQWGRKAHPACPFLTQFGVEGAFWMPEADLQRNLDSRNSEIEIHSNTGDFAPRPIPNNRMGIAA